MPYYNWLKCAIVLHQNQMRNRKRHRDSCEFTWQTDRLSARLWKWKTFKHSRLTCRQEPRWDQFFWHILYDSQLMSLRCTDSSTFYVTCMCTSCTYVRFFANTQNHTFASSVHAEDVQIESFLGEITAKMTQNYSRMTSTDSKWSTVFYSKPFLLVPVLGWTSLCQSKPVLIPIQLFLYVCLFYRFC